jgi:hypothetical protein
MRKKLVIRRDEQIAPDPNQETLENKDNDLVEVTSAEEDTETLNKFPGENTEEKSSLAKIGLVEIEDAVTSYSAPDPKVSSKAFSEPRGDDWTEMDSSKKKDLNQILEEIVREEQLKHSVPRETIELNALKTKSPAELIKYTEDNNIEDVSDMHRQDMIYAILKNFSARYNIIYVISKLT